MAITKEKKHLRRRSNWYIYLISFAATILLLGLIILALWGVIFPGSVSPTTDPRGIMDYIPGDELDATVLFMMGDAQGSTPNKFMLLNYRPRDGVIAVIPLNESTGIAAGNITGKLTDLYKHGGARTVMAGIEQTLGIKCSYYVLLDRSSFIEFTDILGEVRVNIPYEFSHGGITLSAGEHHLPGRDLFTYMDLADFPEAGEDYNLVIMGSAIASLINNNCKNLDVVTIQDAFNKIINTSTTNLTFKHYTNYQRALTYTSQNSINPAIYYVPSGIFISDEFVVSDQSVEDILNRFNLNK